jgi:hypothetical protein
LVLEEDTHHLDLHGLCFLVVIGIRIRVDHFIKALF